MSVSPAELPKDAQRCRPEDVGCRPQVPAEELHELTQARCQQRVEKLGLEVVDPQLESAESEVNVIRGRLQRDEEGAHEQRQEGEQRR